MSDQHPERPLPHEPDAPPTVPGPLVARLAPVPPAWATVLGILSIVFGVLGAISKCWGMATPFIFMLMERLSLRCRRTRCRRRSGSRSR